MNKSVFRLALGLVLVMGLLVAGCAAPKPAPLPTRSQAVATIPWRNTLPPEAWFSIQAAGRVSPFQSDAVIVYADGRAVYVDQSTGKQLESKLDQVTLDSWKRMFETQARFMSLNGDYPAGTPIPADRYPPGSPQGNDALRYTLMYRSGDVVKTITAVKSGVPVRLGIVLDQFWNLIEDIKLDASGESNCLNCAAGV